MCAMSFPAGRCFGSCATTCGWKPGWLEQNLDLKLSEKDLARVREMDNPESIPLAYDIGRMAAERQVKPEHWVTGAAALDAGPIL